MKIDTSKLENILNKDGKITARCPACRANGGDNKGNNLVVYGDGRFGCAAFPNDKEHNKQIFKSVGIGGNAGFSCSPIPIKRKATPEIRTLKIIAYYGDKRPTLDESA